LLFVAVFSLFCGGASAFTVLQFDATASRGVSQTGGVVTAWVSTRGGGVASPCHEAGNGWDAPRYSVGAGIDFAAASGVASPLSFDLTETELVSRAFIVADCTAPAAYGTMLDAPCPLRLAPSDGGGAGLFATSSVLSTIALSIDFAASSAFSPGTHLYEIELFDPCPLSGLHLGGSPATPAWHRNWNGSVWEVVFTSPSATAEDADAIRSYLSKKWGIGRHRSGVAGELAVLKRLGIRTGGVYGSMMFLR
jgi:hypothetical protein